MSILNLACGKKATTDQTQILFQGENLVTITNGKVGCSLNVKDLFWNVNSATCYEVTVPKNTYVELQFKDIFSASTSNVGKFIALKTDNKVVAEKPYENSNLFMSYANSDYVPLGKFFVTSGTNENLINSTFKIFNGTPSGNISNITGGTYDVTLSVMLGYN